MSTEKSYIFVGIVFAVGLFARWGHRSANKKGFPTVAVLLALCAVGVGYALTNGYITIQTALLVCGSLVLFAAIQG